MYDSKPTDTPNLEEQEVFQMKQFAIHHQNSTMKVGLDGVLLGSWVAFPEGTQNVLDVGTGCGIISLMLAQRNASCRISAVEVDRASVEEAKHNARLTQWNDRIDIKHTSIQDFVEGSNGSYDVIVSNPPFFSGGTLSDNLGRQGARHTVKMSHQVLLGAGRDLLCSAGQMAVILPYLEGMRLVELAKNYGLTLVRRATISSREQTKPVRLLLQFSPTPTQMQDEAFHLYDDKGGWSDALWQLTKDFYLHRHTGTS